MSDVNTYHAAVFVMRYGGDAPRHPLVPSLTCASHSIILPSMYGGGTEVALRAGLVAGSGMGAGLIVWAIYRRFRPWQ